MHRALWEFRIRGVVTNLRFLDSSSRIRVRSTASYTTRFIDETPELFRWPRKRDRATRLLTYHRRVDRQRQCGDQGRDRPMHPLAAPACACRYPTPPPPGTQAEAR